MIVHFSNHFRTATAALALAASLALTAGASAQEITVEHAQGETTLPGVPEKVFAFDIATVDTLNAIGVEVDGVPDASFPESLSRYADVMKIGSLFEPDYELVNAEQPDVIFVAGRSSSVYPQLSEIAPTVDLSVDWTDFPTTIKQRSETLGEIFGKQAEVAELIAEVDADIASVQAQAPSVGNALFISVSGGRVSAYGPGSRFGWVHDDLGIVPVIEDVEAATHGEAVSFEFLLETNPDWLFVLDRDAAVGAAEGGQPAAQVLDNEIVHQMSAWQNDQVVYVDPVNFYIVNGGLNALHEMVVQVGTAIGADVE
ncbi:siderophore ABC transporter substrate-binding protein [Pelagibacterium halotolerans]|uniref:Periplasmic binding protein n=1 Tax=Pelagibacterium halotolerans (strain DSM 22347 / JCM 15775 / CGMCC 1.7692 / B2) TaxID=1082931 RepID=G4R6H4_PELHB|nr:periplasmic binding protein [Pelagibacterium halotolerans B2]